jgi:hypothetical protein
MVNPPLSQIRHSDPPDLPALKILTLSEAPIYLNSDGPKKLQLHYWLISATPHEFNHLRGTKVAHCSGLPGQSRIHLSR